MDCHSAISGAVAWGKKTPSCPSAGEVNHSIISKQRISTVACWLLRVGKELGVGVRHFLATKSRVQRMANYQSGNDASMADEETKREPYMVLDLDLDKLAEA